MEKIIKALINDNTDGINILEDRSLDIKKINDQLYHVVHDGKSLEVDVIDVNLNKKQIDFRINGEFYSTIIQEPIDQLIQKMGLNSIDDLKSNDLSAPMPGLIVDVIATVGQEINAGDTLVILEAMKMENVLKINHSAIIKAIHVNTGDKVEKGQLLLEFE